MAELVLALDLPAPADAERLLERLPAVEWVKVGSILFTVGGPSLVAGLKRRGLRVFLDLKWHDIPNTVRGAVARARDLGVDMVTVHALGGRPMMAAAKEAAGSGLLVVAVTILTSHHPEDLAPVLGRPVGALLPEVTRLAHLARSAGTDGVVCSPLEVEPLREALGPEAVLVTPGIRRPTDPAGDQARTATVGEAVRAGSTHLVVGRPVLEAPDPREAWAAMLAEAR